MVKLAKIIVLIVALFSLPVLAVSDSSELTEEILPSILIIELQTGSLDSATQEFLELYNQTDDLIDASSFKIQYLSASGSSWLTRLNLEGQIQPRGRYLISAPSYIDDADMTVSLGLAATGGHIRLVKTNEPEDKFIDQIAWGTAQSALVLPSPAPEAGQSLKRLIDEDGRFIDTNDDSVDFIISLQPTPERSKPLINEEDVIDNTDLTDTDDQAPVESDGEEEAETTLEPSIVKTGPFAKLEITELLIDPDKPLLDAEDEFVELYNPNQESVDLEDYVIETGMKYSYDFVLPNITIKGGQYLAFYSLDTGLALSNSEGQARLLDPAGQVVFEVPSYLKAKPNLTWVNVSKTWQWSDTPTPGASNILTIPSSSSKKKSSTSGSTSKSRTYLTGSSVLGSSNDANRSTYEEPPVDESTQIDKTVVAGVGSLAILYAGYEYRYDIGNRIHQLRRYLGARRGARQTS